MQIVNVIYILERNVERFLKLLHQVQINALQGNDYVGTRAVMFPASRWLDNSSVSFNYVRTASLIASICQIHAALMSNCM